MERKREGDDDEGRKEREGGQCAARRARGREGERRGGEKKKRKGIRKGRDLEDAPTAYRCWSLRKWSVALSGHMKMVSVRGELTVAYNLMFSFLDSFSMGNATARNSRAKLAFLLSLFSGLIALQEPACPPPFLTLPASQLTLSWL